MLQDFLRNLLKFFVKTYQWTLSPALAALGPRCRFYPSCSCYALSALDKYPVPSALVKISHRLLRCGPWHPGGIDYP